MTCMWKASTQVIGRCNLMKEWTEFLSIAMRTPRGRIMHCLVVAIAKFKS